MGIMAGGAETTREDRFVYSQDVQEMIYDTLKKLERCDDYAPAVRQSSKRNVLEAFAWAVVLKSEE